MHKVCDCRARTDIVGHTSNPNWVETFEVPVADEVSQVCFLLKDDHWIGKLPKACNAQTASCPVLNATALSKADFGVCEDYSAWHPPFGSPRHDTWDVNS